MDRGVHRPLDESSPVMVSATQTRVHVHRRFMGVRDTFVFVADAVPFLARGLACSRHGHEPVKTPVGVACAFCHRRPVLHEHGYRWVR